jgi:hypothetical protein
MGTWIALLAALAAALSAAFVWLQVHEMQRQTDLQRQISRAASEPYVWADIRATPSTGFNLQFALGNTGKTTATNVRVTITPPLPDHTSGMIDSVQAKLAAGLASVAPGALLTWRVGPAPDVLANERLAHTIRIECDGPYGPIAPHEYVIDIAALRDTQDIRVGTLHEVADSVSKSIDKLTAALKGSRQ